MGEQKEGIGMGNLELRTSEALLERHAYYSRLTRMAADKVGRLEHEITRRMQADGATEMVAAGHKATLTTSVSYDQGRLRAVMEWVSENELVDKGAYIPEHEETRVVPSRWNATKLKTFTKRGHEVQEIINAAKVKGAPRLKIEEI